jgi:hypothetical protein
MLQAIEERERLTREERERREKIDRAIGGVDIKFHAR